MRRVLFFAFLFTGTAQRVSAQGWTGGFKGGLGQGGFTGTSAFAWSATGLNVAAFVSRPVAATLFAQLELSASQKVGESKVGGSLLTFTADYLSLPLLLRVDLPAHRGFTPFAVVGPSVSVQTRCRTQLVVAGFVSNINCEQPSIMNRVDLGLVGGAGVSRGIGAATIGVEARSSFNMRSVALPDASGFGRSIAWAVLVGVSTPLQRPLVRPAILASEPSVSPILIDVIAASDSGGATRVSVRATEADVRTLLLALARHAGVSLLVSDDVKGKVTLAMSNATVAEAIQAVIAESGLSFAETLRNTTYPSLVYSAQLPGRPR